MKILHILNDSVPHVSGYASRSQYIVEFQKRMSFTPIVVTSTKHGRPGSAVEHINGIDYHRCDVPQRPMDAALDKVPLLNEWRRMRILERAVEAVASEHAVDVIHAHSPILCGMPAARVAHRLHIPFVYEVRALWEDAAVDQARMREGDLRYRLIRKLESDLLRRSDNVVVICQGLKNEIESRGVEARRIHVIPNGVDTGAFVPVPRDAALAQQLGVDRGVVIGFIGKFFKFEGLDVLLRAMARVTTHCPECRLVIVGHGNESAALQALSRELKLEDRVVFAGKVPHADIVKYYSIMDVLVYPRIRLRITEMVTPIKTLEALSMEKAVVASDVGGLKELVDDNRTGLLFKAEDADDLAAKLLRLAGDASLRRRLGAAGRAAMIESRGWAKLIAPYSDIYGNLVKSVR